MNVNTYFSFFVKLFFKKPLTKTKNKTIIPRNKIYQEILRQEE